MPFGLVQAQHRHVRGDGQIRVAGIFLMEKFGHRPGPALVVAHPHRQPGAFGLAGRVGQQDTVSAVLVGSGETNHAALHRGLGHPRVEGDLRPGLSAVAAPRIGTQVLFLPAAHVHVDTPVRRFHRHRLVREVDIQRLAAPPGLAVVVAVHGIGELHLAPVGRPPGFGARGQVSPARDQQPAA